MPDALQHMKRYPAYKDSGIEWLGDVPVHWTIRKLKHIASVRYSNVDKNAIDGEIPISLCNYVDVYYNDRITHDLDFMEASATPVEIEKFELKDGDVLLTKDSESWEDIAVPAYVPTDVEGVLCGYHLAQIRPKSTLLHGEYLFRSFGSIAINYQFKIAATGITRYGLGNYWLDNALFPVPSLAEQRAIADYIERETSKIDGLITKKEKLIKLLEEKRTALISHAVTKGLNPHAPMKESGIEWLGEIPENWEAEKLKRISSKIGSGKTPKGGAEIYSDSGVLFLRSQNIHFKGMQLDDVAYIDDVIDADMTTTRVLPEDVLLNITGASLGRCSLVPNTFPSANVNQHVCIIRPIKARMSPRYLFYCISSDFIQAQIFSAESGTSREGLSFPQIGNLAIPRPIEVTEQNAIADFLDHETAKFDTLTSKVREHIAKLQEYRTALISAAVTGKICVKEQEATAQRSKDESKHEPKANAYFRRSVLAAEIVHQLHNENTFGRVKLQKIIFLAEHHLGIEGLETNYYRDAAGPFDNRSLRSVEKQIQDLKWYRPVSRDGGKGTLYEPMEKAGGHSEYFERYWGDKRDGLNDLLKLLRTPTTKHCEILATLYAVWNDFLIDGVACQDDDIIHEVLTNWHDDKKNIPESEWRRLLGVMHKIGLVPRGTGERTRHKA